MKETAPRRPGRPAQPVTHDQLLRVARQAFAERGYSGASMGEIAAGAGIRKSSLFHHFATKDELYREAVAGVFEDISSRMMKAHERPGTFLERMDRATFEIQRYLGEDPAAARILVRVFVSGGRRILPGDGEALDGLLKPAIDLLEQVMSEGIIVRQNAEHLAMSMGGVHLLFFAAPEVSSRCIGNDVFAEKHIEERARVVCAHVRRLAGAPLD